MTITCLEKQILFSIVTMLVALLCILYYLSLSASASCLGELITQDADSHGCDLIKHRCIRFLNDKKKTVCRSSDPQINDIKRTLPDKDNADKEHKMNSFNTALQAELMQEEENVTSRIER